MAQITVKEEWERFKEVLNPRDFDENQMEYLQMSFYSGVYQILRVLENRVSLLPEELAVRVLEGLKAEVVTHMHDQMNDTLDILKGLQNG